MFESFTKLIEKHSKENTIAYHKEFSVMMGQKIARKTPVDTGRATANWKAGVNKEPRGRSDEYDTSSTAQKTANEMRKDLRTLGIKDTVIIRNAVNDGEEDSEDYILKLENGASQQAPNGMFMVNVTRYKQIAKEAIKKLGLK